MEKERKEEQFFEGKKRVSQDRNADVEHKG